MDNTEKLHRLKKKIPKSLKKLFPKFIKQKLTKMFFPYYFIYKIIPKQSITIHQNFEIMRFIVVALYKN